MKRRLVDIACVFRIHLARLRREAGPFVLAAIVFPAAMYLFANAIGSAGNETHSGAAITTDKNQLRFLAASIVFSLSLTAISWLGYLLLENRFTGRLKLFATLPLAVSSYVFGVLLFALAQSALGTISLLVVARIFGVRTALKFPLSAFSLVAVIVLTMLCLCGVSVIIAARARSFSEGSLLTDALGAGLVMLAPVYYNADALPRPVRIVAEMLPTSFAARAVRTTLEGGFAIGNELAALALMSMVTLFLGFRLMKWRED